VKAEVVFLPSIATDLSLKLCIVVDVLRATSTLVSMFEAGARKVVLAGSIPAALEYAASRAERPAVCGESGGLRPDGFDHGNSPREFPPGSLEGKEVAFCTSNGTRAMARVAEAPVVLAGSLLNGSAVARAAVREARERRLNLAVICSGDSLGSKFAIDDAFCAAHLLTLIHREAARTEDAVQMAAETEKLAEPGMDPGWDHLEMEEAAVAALRLYGSYLGGQGTVASGGRPPRDAILTAFWEARNARSLRRVGLAEDVEYCAQLDISNCVPRLRREEERLVLYPC